MRCPLAVRESFNASGTGLETHAALTCDRDFKRRQLQLMRGGCAGRGAGYKQTEQADALAGSGTTPG